MLTEAILLEQNRRLREENEELRETVRLLREAAEDREPLPSELPYLTTKEEQLFRSLRRHAGYVSRETIYADLYGHDESVDIHIIQVFVSHLRRKLVGTSFRVETTWGRGYSLVNSSLIEVNGTLKHGAGTNVSGRETLAA